jgi:hypothetical protein
MQDTTTTTRPDLAELIGDLAARALASRSRMTREELVPRVFEGLVLHVLEIDERFHGSAKGLYWQLTERLEQNELARRRQEERDAEGAAAGEGAAYAAHLARARAELGVTVTGRKDEPRVAVEPVFPGGREVLDDEEAAAL